MTVEQGLDPSVGFAQRAQNVMDAAPGLDHQTVASLALQSQTPDQATTNAQSVAQAISQTWDGYEQSFADPVLQQQPSLQSHVVQYIHDTIGAPPIDAGTISQLQKTLQQDGLGSGLATDGAWTPDWQQQYNSAVSTLKANQLAGDKPGSVKTSSALHGFLSHLTVTGALDSIGGWVKSIPDDARKVAGTVAGGATGLVHVVAHPSEILGQSEAEKESIASANRIVQNALGGNVTQQQEVKAENWGSQAAVLNDALTFMGATGVLRKAAEDVLAKAAGEVLAKGAPELARQPGVIAKTLFNGSQNGRLLGAKWVGNLPGLARVTPTIGRVAGKDGWYYTARTFMAQPYRQPLVRAAGTAFSRTQVLGAGLYGDALATSKLPDNTQSQNIIGERAFDAIDHNLTNYGPKVFGWSPLDVNNLQLFLHGPFSGAESASQSVGAHTQHFVNGITDALGTKGIPAAFQQATGLSRSEWLASTDGDSNFLGQHMMDKVWPMVADWYAERQIGAPIDLADAAQKTQIAGLRDQFFADPNLMTKTMADMVHSDSNLSYLTRRIGNGLTKSISDPKTAYRQSLVEFKAGAQQMQKMAQAGDFKFYQTPEGIELEKLNRVLGGPSDATAIAAPPLVAGQLGLMGINGLTREMVNAKNGIADQFEQRMAASQDSDADAAVAKDMTDHLFINHNWDDKKLQQVAGNPAKLLAAVRSEGNDLASTALPTFDRSPAAAAREAELNALGYKMVIGSHIGHLYDGTLPPLGENNQWLTALRKWAGKSGLDPSRVPDVEVGRATQQGIVDEFTHDLATDPRLKGKLREYQTPQTLMSMVSADQGIQKSLPWYSRAIFAATSHIGLNKTEIQALQDATPLDANGTRMTEQAARGELEQRMASGLGPRDASRKAFVKAVMTTHEVKMQNGDTWTWHGLQGGDLTAEQRAADPAAEKAYQDAQKTANLLFRSMVNGYRQPGYMMGWNAIENWGRAGYGIGDWAAKRLPGSSLLQNVANWPNRVAQVRNQLRFTVSPIFDLRRWTKQSLKMGLEGVDPVANPLQALMDSGDVDSAGKLLAQIGHSPINEDQINADRMLASRSVFGLYSPQWHGAYFVNELRKQGKSTDEITQAYNRVFKYGADGGQSSLERTMNTIFFPFSFEKTLLRNTGGYLLDHPAQALALDLAVDEWRKADQNAEFGKFVMNHLPLLTEMNTLNAFSHGLSPGQFGGINAPTLGAIGGDAMHAYQNSPNARMAALNFFLPQNWGANMSPSNLQKYLPVWSQGQKVIAAATEQARIGYAALYDTAQQAAGGTKRLPTLTAIGQQQYGTREKVNLINKMAPVLSFNGKVADDASKIPWQAGPNIPANLVGSPINRTTIGQYVQSLYPEYDPTSGSLFAQQQQVALGKYIANIKATDPAKGAEMAQFAKTANSVIGKINRDEYTSADQATIQGLLHEIGRQGASSDPDWSKLYSGFFAYALGPIQSPDGKGLS